LILELAQEYSRDLFIFVKNTGNSKKKVSGSSDLSRKGHAFPGQALCKGPKFIFIIWGLWVSQDAEFKVDFKNINLTY
jgi:hypothetical protein